MMVYAATSSGDSGSGSSTALGGSSSSSSVSSTPSSGVNSGSPGSSSSGSSAGSSGGVSTIHCDRPGYPSCSSLGSAAAQNAAPGSSCPIGHSKAFCNAYNAATGSSYNQPGSSQQASSAGINNTAPHSQQRNTAHCDRLGYPPCYSLGFQDKKANPGSSCPIGHSANYCAGWNAAVAQQPNPPYRTSACTGFVGIPCSTATGKVATGFGTIRELAPGAKPGPHTLEYVMAFNTAAGNPYKPGTRQFDDYQAGLDDAMKAGRDCDKMDTCGGPDLLGNWVNGVLHLSGEQYCGNGFGVYSGQLCSGFKGCTANSIGEVTCPYPTKP
jgi:hypothetical protein